MYVHRIVHLLDERFRVAGPRTCNNIPAAGGQTQVDACGRGWGVQPHVDVHTENKLKLESTDVILSSSHAKKWASFFTRISSLDRKKVKIFLRYNFFIQITNSTV